MKKVTTSSNQDDTTSRRITEALKLAEISVNGIEVALERLWWVHNEAFASQRQTGGSSSWTAVAETIGSIAEELNANKVGVYCVNCHWAAFCQIDGKMTEVYSISLLGSLARLLTRLSESPISEQNEAARRLLANLPK